MREDAHAIVITIYDYRLEFITANSLQIVRFTEMPFKWSQERQKNTAFSW